MDAKTLKYQLHSAQSELKKQIQQQQQVLTVNQKYIEMLEEENEKFRQEAVDLVCTKYELKSLQQKWCVKEREAEEMEAKVGKTRYSYIIPVTN